MLNNFGAICLNQPVSKLEKTKANRNKTTKENKMRKKRLAGKKWKNALFKWKL